MLIKALLDANINGNVSAANLDSKSLTTKTFYDLGIARNEDDDQIAKIMHSKHIYLMITQDASFGHKTGARWKKIKGFALLIPSDPVVRVFRSNKPNKALLSQIVSAIKQADTLRWRHRMIHVGLDPLSPNRVVVTI